MSDIERKPEESGSEQIFVQIEENLEPGGVRDLWLALRRELNEGGPQSVRTYMEAEYKRRKAILQNGLSEVSDHLEETS